MSEYILKFNANIIFDYHPLKKSYSSDYDTYIDYSETETYDESHEIKLTITPKMLLECFEYLYGKTADKYSNQLVKALNDNEWFFDKMCREIFDEENLDYYSYVYDWLLTTDEYKEQEKIIINQECQSLGELIE